MKDNNPFQPTLAQPADDSILASDAHADDFSADFAPKKAPRVSLDGISPNRFGGAVDKATLDAALDDHDFTDNSAANSADFARKSETAPTIADLARAANDKDFDADLNANFGDFSADAGENPREKSSISDEKSGAEIENSANSVNSSSSEEAENPEISAEKSFTKADLKAQKLAEKAEKSARKSDKNAEFPEEKPAHEFHIPFFAIVILLIVAIAGVGGAIYFYLQNSKNASELADTRAALAQYTGEESSATTSSNKTAGQVSSLNDKIADLTKEKTDLTKANDDLTKKNADLTKTNEDLTKANTDLTAKVTNIDNLTTQISGILGKNCKNADGSACTATITQENGQAVLKISAAAATTQP